MNKEELWRALTEPKICCANCKHINWTMNCCSKIRNFGEHCMNAGENGYKHYEWNGKK